MTASDAPTPTNASQGGDAIAAKKLHRVVGPPGCGRPGKTTYIARQVEVASGKYRKEEVAVVSLTKAAATEAAGRVELPATNVSTLHAMAFRALKHPKIAETSVGLSEWNEWVGVSAWRIGNRYAADPENAAAEPASFDDEGGRLLSQVAVLRALCRPSELWPADAQAFHQRWQEFKAQRGWMDFTDLIDRALSDVEFMPGEPQVVFADEAQDMSRLEMRLLRKWGASAEQLVVVGDPDQALYTWRGADPDGVFGTDRDEVIVLQQGYRVPAAVLEVAQAFIERMVGRLPISYLPRVDDAGHEVAGEVCEANYGWEDPIPLLDLIRADLSDGKSVMVLGSCGYMLAPLIATLRAQGEPFHNPYRASYGPWNPLANAKRLLAFLRPRGDVWGTDNRLWTWDDLRLWTEPLQAAGSITRGSKALIEAKCRQGRFDTQAHEIVTLATLMQLFEEDALAHVYDMDIDWWEDRLRAADRKRQSFSLAIARNKGPARLRVAPKLIVGTMHSVKGGQADSVYVFPDLSQTGYWEGYRQAPELESHKSTLRTFYVGMTRAREKLTLCKASSFRAVDW